MNLQSRRYSSRGDEHLAPVKAKVCFVYLPQTVGTFACSWAFQSGLARPCKTAVKTLSVDRVELKLQYIAFQNVKDSLGFLQGKQEYSC